MAALCRLPLLLLCVWSGAANREEGASCGGAPVDDADIALIQMRPSRASETIVASLGARGVCSTTNWDSCQPSPYTGTCQGHLEYSINTEKKSCQDAVATVTSQCPACSVCSADDCPTPEPTPAPAPTPPASCSSAAWGSCQPAPNTGSCLDHLNYALNTERKSCQDALDLVSSQCSACSVCSTSDCPVPIPSKYYPHFDTTADHLGIAANAAGVNGNAGSVSDNFYLVIGDQGGCDGGMGCGMQQQVAQKMLEYVQKRKAKNPNSKLLFVLAVGDNFYWTGASEGRFSGTWLDVYGDELTSVPWFAVMGNHDYGNNDAGSACPSVRPRFTCNSSNANAAACGGAQPYSSESQGYNSNQLNANKGGVDGDTRANWHMPDYTYFYTIPELDFELVAMDWNWYDLGGLGGDASGSTEVRANCGSSARLDQSMRGIMDASTDLLHARAKVAESSNVAIIGHYPDWSQGNQNFRSMYLDALPAGKTDSTKVFNFYGHDHSQRCYGTEGNECVNFLTGGGGGCCSTGSIPAGFVAIAFDNEKKQVVECFSSDPECTLNHYSQWQGMAAPDVMQTEVCMHTRDDPKCPNYAGPNSTLFR